VGKGGLTDVVDGHFEDLMEFSFDGKKQGVG
jgi:hypothetical protein